MTYILNFAKATKEDVLFFKGVVSQALCTDTEKMLKTSLFARALLIFVMGELYGEKSIELTFNEKGKPYLAASPYKISISHSKIFAMISVSKKETGCDVQEISHCNMKIAKRYFTLNESEMLEKSENPDEAFTRLWCLKEAALKNTGDGLSGGLSSFEFHNKVNEKYFEKYGMRFTSEAEEGSVFAVCGFSDKESFTKVELCEIRDYFIKINNAKTERSIL